ncbi:MULTISPECIES: DUF3189 family protein [Thermoanaerobacter]|jgi:hypothetical protein|uniref:DUF3189 domain-containing protein n=2 Tax=Thermoanaerobacter TaxID=1754 RepID=B0K944_THEP3|nr:MULTISPECIES: DUF3189 family protein [Thermoanaerobacter]ABY94657.1 hypothetical protein Teth39_1002 [Thermoanaerobacter pseudethanolicus ATCC 33223]ADV79604.1 hypothetical protein Thebr_1028 [Thermoanaerobacter brockii subsp. finnii Ako-1]HBW60652.1 DUF3189 domain-containing protein [Thermoanaerobacter sp.]
MHIIYHCYGGTHTSVIAAYIHTGKLSMDKIPSREEIENIPLFDKLNGQNDPGHIVPIGTDEYGNNIYSMGVKNAKKLIEPALKDLYYHIFNTNEGLLLIDTTAATNWIMKIGGFTSIALKFPVIGRPLVIYGTQKAYKKIVQIVKNVKAQEKAEYNAIKR